MGAKLIKLVLLLKRKKLSVFLISELSEKEEALLVDTLLSMTQNKGFIIENICLLVLENRFGTLLNGEKETCKQFPIEIDIPIINKSKCRYCASCLKFCHFNALKFYKEVPDIYVNTLICTGCGKCIIGCSSKSVISTKKYQIGEVNWTQFQQNISHFVVHLNEGQEQFSKILEWIEERTQEAKFGMVEIETDINRMDIYKTLMSRPSYFIYNKMNGISTNLRILLEASQDIENEMFEYNTYHLVGVDFNHKQTIQAQLEDVF